MRGPQGQVQQAVHGGHVVDFERPGEVGAELLVDVLAVAFRQNDARQAAAVRGEDLVPDAAGRQHVAGQRDLARHGQAGAKGAPRARGDQRGRHRDAGRGALLRRLAREVQMDVGVLGEARGREQLDRERAAWERTVNAVNGVLNWAGGTE